MDDPNKKSTPPKPMMKVAVWFDRARDVLCIADRLDSGKIINGKEYKYEEGSYIPDQLIVKIPLLFGEEFIEAVFQAANAGSEFCKIMDGVQRLLDGRAMTAVDLTEHLRSELSKRSGGGVVQASQRFMQLPADRVHKLYQLHRKVCEFMEDKGVDEDLSGAAMSGYDKLKNWMQENGLYEPGQLPQAEEGQHEGQP